MPNPAPAALMASLNAAGITRIVLGHTPHGDCPTVIKSGGPGTSEAYLEVLPMAPDGFWWLPMAPDGFWWLPMARDGSRWPPMASDGF